MAEGSSDVAEKGGFGVGNSVEGQEGGSHGSMRSMFYIDESSMASQFSSQESSTGEAFRSLVRKNDEYTTQFFGFTTKSFCNGIYNAYSCLLLDVLETWSEFVYQQFSLKCGLTQESMNAGCENIRKALVSKIDKGFDRLELYMENNMFHVPRSVLLEEDKAHGLWDPSAEDEAEVDREIQELTDKILAQKYANAVLREELKVVEAAQQQSETILEQFTDFWKVLKESKDLGEALVFKLNRLHQCLETTEKIAHLSQNSDDFPQKDPVCRSLDAEIEILGQESNKKGSLD